MVDDERDGANLRNHHQSRMTRGRRYNVLFICPDNAVYSIMAEALMRRWGGNDFCVFSAGIEPRRGINRRTRELLKEQRLWDPSLRSNGASGISRGGRAADGFRNKSGRACSRWRAAAMAGGPQVIHWHITSADAIGQPAEVACAFRKAFTELETRIKHASLHEQQA